MDWITRFTRAMDYIEDNLDGEIDWEQAGREALCSSQLFARMFAMMTDIPLSEYIRRRRLTRAAFDLQANGDKVLDVALRYGYASPTAFQRAFTQFHDVTPSQARKQGIRLQAYPRMAFQLKIEGGIALQYRIEQKPAFRVVGYMENVSMVDGENFRRIPKMWDEFPAKRFQALEGYMKPEQPGMFGAMDMAEKPDELIYCIAVASDRTDLQDWMSAMDVPASTYAVFETSMKDLQNVTRRIFAEWLPNSGYEHGPSPEFEFYPPGDMESEESYKAEIWIPVVKK